MYAEGSGEMGRKRRVKARRIGRDRYRCADGNIVKVHKGKRGGEFIMSRKKGGGVERRYI